MMVVTAALINLGTQALKEVLIETFKDKTAKIIENLDVDIDCYINTPICSKGLEGYVNSFLSRHGKIKILGMRDSRDIASIYTETYILKGDQDGEGIDSIDDLISLYEKSGSLSTLHDDKYDAIVRATEYIGIHPRIVVMGAPGAGKTTLLKRVGIEFLKGQHGFFPDHKLIPVFIPLKIFWEKEIDLKRAIAEELKICRFPNSKYFIEHLLGKGRLIVLLDALDEMPTDKKINAVRKIQDFADSYNKNRN